MKTKLFILLFLCFLVSNSFSQTNVRAWYADGQVFVVWEISAPIEETYGIYASTNSFANTANATLIGRPFSFEYLGFGLKDNLDDANATFRVPDGQGGYYQLAMNEGLFVFTPHQTGSLYFAVTKWGDNNVIAGQNITDTSVPFIFDPVGDPVECHLQLSFPSPFVSGYACFAYVVWADGRQNHWEGRPDFPIMANAAKNGMPGIFLGSAPVNLDTSEPFPLSIWLHGGGGIARQSLAGSRKEVNIDPEQGVLIAHDDKMYGYRGSTPPNQEQPTWHFGWAKNYDPFSSNGVLSSDTIINYTQRRYLWINNWLSKNFNVDTSRINIHGHSMGSAGAIAIAKCHPNNFGSVTLFNTGCSGPEDIFNTTYMFGTSADNFPTNLINRNGESVRFYDLWDLYTNCSPERDLPLIRHWHGKNDDNTTMLWSPAVVNNYIVCDSIGTGIQNGWSERPHGIDLAPDYNDHWIIGISGNQQISLDNVNFPEVQFRSDESFPAFYNHRLDAKNNDPGTGLIGINNGDGDNWGTWGGYHRWSNVEENVQQWQVTAWLESQSSFSNENSSNDFLTADLAIRRPQQFMPAEGENVTWDVKDFSNGNVLQSGTSIVQPDDLVVIPQIDVYKENIRKVIITINSGNSSLEDINSPSSVIAIIPNPTQESIYTESDWNSVFIFDVNGREIKQISLFEKNKTIDVSDLPNGYYNLIIHTHQGHKKAGKLIKI